jgi:hypothetical protein
MSSSDYESEIKSLRERSLAQRSRNRGLPHVAARRRARRTSPRWKILGRLLLAVCLSRNAGERV